MVPVLYALLCALALVAVGDLREAPLTAVTVLLCWGAGLVLLLWRRPRELSPLLVLAAAVAVRAVLLASPPSLSDDVFRYVWEGLVVAAGENPFAHPPADPFWRTHPELGHVAVRDLVNHPEVSTIYPPLALWLFAAVSSVWPAAVAMKLAMALFDAGIAWGLAAIARQRYGSTAPALLYALHPLGAVESAGSGHLEPVAVCFLVLALWGWGRAGGLRADGDPRAGGLGWAVLGGLVKLLPFVLIPTLWRGRWVRLLAGVGLAVLVSVPFVDAGDGLGLGFSTYAQHWSFNASGFRLLDAVLGTHARPAGLGIGAAVTTWALLRYRDPAQVALWVGGAFLLLSPTVHPWYTLWAWVPALVLGIRAWTVLATLMPAAYVVLATLDPATGAWQESGWTAVAIYVPFLVALGAEGWARWQTPGPWPPDGRRTRDAS